MLKLWRELTRLLFGAELGLFLPLYGNMVGSLHRFNIPYRMRLSFILLVL